MNHMILAINQDKPGYNLIIGFMVIEDKRRAGKLEDFDYLNACFNSDEEWDDFRNFITIKIYTFNKLSDDECSDLEMLASTFIEFKPSINYRVDFFVDSTLLVLYEECMTDVNNMDMTRLYEKLLSDSENVIDLNINDYNHLIQ